MKERLEIERERERDAQLETVKENGFISEVN